MEQPLGNSNELSAQQKEEKNMSENRELNFEEMDQVAGGYKKPPEKAGFIIYQIQKGEVLSRIAKKFNTTVAMIMAWNPKITNPDKIYAGDYLYIKQ